MNPYEEAFNEKRAQDAYNAAFAAGAASRDAEIEALRADAESWRKYKARKDAVIAAGMGRNPLRESSAMPWGMKPMCCWPAQVPAGSIRLWDAQWVSIVNHDNAYNGWSTNDAVNHAVRMTERYIAANVAQNNLPPLPAAPEVK